MAVYYVDRYMTGSERVQISFAGPFATQEEADAKARDFQEATRGMSGAPVWKTRMESGVFLDPRWYQLREAIRSRRAQSGGSYDLALAWVLDEMEGFNES